MSDTSRWKQSERWLTMGSRQLESLWRWALAGRGVAPGFGGVRSGGALDPSKGAGVGTGGDPDIPRGEGMLKLFS